jgi:hypothetical protein
MVIAERVADRAQGGHRGEQVAEPEGSQRDEGATSRSRAGSVTARAAVRKRLAEKQFRDRGEPNEK